MSSLLERLQAALAGRYTVERELGQGGMATVFLAHDLKHERRVAIKVMTPDLAAMLGSERFLREIKTAAQLTHPNILPLYDSGDAAGLLYYVMPLVEGGSLRERLDREGALPLDAALRIAQEVAEALHHAHSLGFVHRDIKPENILFIADRPVVADFGIARAVSAAGGQQLTQTGMAVGTPAYMSPEQAAGDPHIDGRSDIYALGCVLYEILAGHPPFMGRNAREVLARQVTDQVPPLRTARPTVPPNVDATVERALAKVPADRFATAREFAEAIAGRRADGPMGRSVPPLAIVAGYVIFAMLAWLAVRWIAEREALSPHLPTFVLATLALLLPAVALGGHFVGRWRRVHTAGVVLNVAIAAGLLALLFGGRSLGAVTTSVVLTTEEGNRVRRVIPRPEFRERVALFYFDAAAGDSAAAELAYGIPDAIALDLLQDLFVDMRVPPQFRQRLQAAGYPSLRGIPLALARDIATEEFREEFVTGSVRTEGAEIVVTMTVYRTANGEKVREATVRGSDPLALADLLSTQVKRTVDVPAEYAAAAIDLPVRELLTRSAAAFAHYVRASRALSVDNDFARAAAELERAVALDSTFAVAQWQLSGVYLLSNRVAQAQRPIQAAVNQSFRLPERLRNQVKANYYELRQEQDKMFAVVEMNAELYPTDLIALQALSRVQALRGQRRAAIATFERMLAVDPRQHDYLRTIGELQQAEGMWDEALETFERYVELNPNDARGFLAIGDLRRIQGRHDEARAAFARAALLPGREVQAELRLAALDLGVGRLAEARRGYEGAMERARTAGDSAAVLDGMVAFATVRGRIRDAIALKEQVWAKRARSSAPIQIMVQRLTSLGLYVAIGDTARARELLARYKQELQPPFHVFRPLGDLDIARELEDAAAIDSGAAAVEALISQSGYEFLRPAAVYSRGLARYLAGDYRAAIAAWEEEGRLSPGDPGVPRQLGEAYRELGEHRRAEAAFREALRLRPADPRTRYELALLEEARGRREQAVEQLEAALATWAEADPEYKWARRAREKLAALRRD